MHWRVTKIRAGVRDRQTRRNLIGLGEVGSRSRVTAFIKSNPKYNINNMVLHDVNNMKLI